MTRRGQFATEHLMVIVVAILIIIPLINLIYSYSSKQTEGMAYSQVWQIGNRIVDNAETVYYMGPPARMTVEENFPDRIGNITILGDQEIVFEMESTDTEMAFLSKVPIEGPFYKDTSQLCITADNACYSSGLKKVTLQSNGSHTLVIIQ